MQSIIHNVLSVRLSEDEQDVVVLTKDETPQVFSRAEWDFEKRVSIWQPLTPEECKPAEKVTQIALSKQ